MTLLRVSAHWNRKFFGASQQKWPLGRSPDPIQGPEFGLGSRMNFLTSPAPTARPQSARRVIWATACALGVGLALPLKANELVCHYDYGGEVTALPVAPTTAPYAVPAIKIGSFFKFRVVWQTAPADLAAVHVYVYLDAPDAPTLLQQGTWVFSVDHPTGTGFTGLQRVYEPVRGSELQYWCVGSAPARGAP